MKRFSRIGPLLSVFLCSAAVLGTDAGQLLLRDAIHDDNPHVYGSWYSTEDSLDEPAFLDDSFGGVDNFAMEDEIQVCGCFDKAEPCGDCVRTRCETQICNPKRRKSQRVFGSIEYLNWWSKGQDLPPLVAGGDGLPPSPIIFGGQEVGDEYQSALRGTVGFWLDDCKRSAWVTRGFVSDGTDAGVAGLSDGTPPLAIPFINDGSNPLLAGRPDSLVIADAGLLQAGVPGGVQAGTSTDIFGFDTFIRKQFRQGCGWRIDWLAGYQYTRIDDNVFLSTATNRVAGSTFETFDLFDARNHYNAGELGMLLEGSRGPLTIQIMGKIALGNMDQQISIQGANRVNSVATGGGIFAQNQSAAGGPTFNVGEYERNEFAWSPELNIKTIWCLRENVDLTIGYTFMYWSDVLLAGEQIDTRVNRDVLFDGPFIPGGGSNPSFQYDDTDYWVNSFDMGFLFRY